VKSRITELPKREDTPISRRDSEYSCTGITGQQNSPVHDYLYALCQPLLYQGRYVNIAECGKRVAAQTRAAHQRVREDHDAGGKSGWMQGFFDRPSLPLWQAIEKREGKPNWCAGLGARRSSRCKPKASAPRHHHPDMHFRPKRKPSSRNPRVRRSVTEPAPSPRLFYGYQETSVRSCVSTRIFPCR
jgi:hypothetical protein